MKLLLFPLMIMFMVSLFAMMGLGSGTFLGEGTYLEQFDGASGYYDENMHQVTYLNGSCTGEAGTLFFSDYDYTRYVFQGDNYWTNTTGSYTITRQEDLTSAAFGFNIGGAIGFIAIISVAILAAAVIGLRIFGNGTSEVSVGFILKAGAFTVLWGILSFISFGLITSIPTFGAIFYLTLTLFYTIGIFSGIGNGGSD